MAESIRFVLAPHIALADAERSLHLAQFAVEGLVGLAQVRLEGQYRVDPDRHAIAIDGGTQVGRLIARVFAGFLCREFGEDAFRIVCSPSHALEREEVSA